MHSSLLGLSPPLASLLLKGGIPVYEGHRSHYSVWGVSLLLKTSISEHEEPYSHQTGLLLGLGFLTFITDCQGCHFHCKVGQWDSHPWGASLPNLVLEIKIFTPPSDLGPRCEVSSLLYYSEITVAREQSPRCVLCNSHRRAGSPGTRSINERDPSDVCCLNCKMVSLL